MAIKRVTTNYSWRAVLVQWTEGNSTQPIYIIDDYENFFKYPLKNGTTKYVSTTTLERAWICEQDLIFLWYLKVFDDGTFEQGPVHGSHTRAFGDLKSAIASVRASL